jgi:hypothetical protein
MRACPFSRGAIALTVLRLVGFTSGAAARDRDTLWTKVTAAGETITLSWDKNHPWDADLKATGAQLIARYRGDAGNEVAESFGRATPSGKNERTIHFTLPHSTNRPAAGPVCLVLQLPNGRVLPVRRATQRGDDTAGFRYDAVEKAMRPVEAGRCVREPRLCRPRPR